ncbi:ARK kinase [Pseudocercospora fijiensis CIRAD86]|uniref:non-specific serine/threonine protein kinase n=1 Tax=Pseudocercospora fijiensis (strain CIRAD86) TaxID=383855 RepID=N1QCY8_PSEFD|nr:ARK kinase [Pseudocercospora fijiensis CIRAD86]EME89797.1 ARK kinase [Pseudocercospora fijiensis CIRAD86]
MSSQPPGTFLPNTKVTVGSHKVYIEKYLSEGGFAHVYVVRIPRENNKHELAVLKRVAVPDREHLASMRTEVETMKKLKGHAKIVTYYDSHASQLKGGGYEVFLLMEYCNGGGLIDFMNTRLQHRLTEPEILKIFGDCAEGVATMHYLKPPLLHRDLKVENVLISKSTNGSPVYKICDFGSAAQPRPAAKTAEEGRLIEEDVQKHTTMQYRSPEMIDVWRKQPINEKADIWALGVLLYKLCYYTTPFEAVGQMAILNASFKYPSYPPFSDRLKKLIGWMLKEDPGNRPNIYQVIKEVCSMRGSEIPIKDIYANRTHSEARRNEALPSPDAVSTAPVGLQKTAPQVQVQQIPEITPMRRGRLPAPTQQAAAPAKPASSPARDDPFAALDHKNYDVRAGAVDELSKRFPSVDEFSIAVDGGKFAFPPTSPPVTSTKTDDPKSLNQRVTNALADEVFSPKLSGSPVPASSSKASRVPTEFASGRVAQKVETAQASPGKSEFAGTSSGKEHSSRPVAQQVQQFNQIEQPLPIRPGFNYKTTAVGSSPPPGATKKLPNVNDRPIWRVPESSRPSSQSRASEEAQAVESSLKPSLPPTQRPGLLDVHRPKSQIGTLAVDHSSSSSRPSLEGGRPSAHELADAGIHRAKSLNARSRPTSMYVSSNMDYLRDQEQQRKRPSLEIRRHSRHASQGRDPISDEAAIEDDMEFLRDGEVSSDHRKMLKGSHHRKRPSLGEIGKKFGNAFKRFDNNDSKRTQQGFATPETHNTGDGPQMLSPITGSEATPSRHSDMNSDIDETEDLPPDVKRELERQSLAAEEKRVTAAAEEYRARVANQGPGNAIPSRASTIQKRVQSLLDEGRQSPQPRRTAEGYGRYTESSDPITTPPPPAASSTESAPLQRVVSRPSAPPKPTVLRTGGVSDSRAPTKPTQDPVKAVQPEQTDVESFSKRYPSLNIEMVETEIGSERRTMRVKEI